MRLDADSDERLDRFLARTMPEHSRTKLAELAKKGIVLVNGKPRSSSFMLRAGDVVELDDPAERSIHDLAPSTMALEVVYEDASLLVVNKPRGLATHPAPNLHEPTLVNALLGRGQGLSHVGEAFRPGIVHRLDKPTTGLLIVAKTDRAHRVLKSQIESKVAERRYFAVAMGTMPHERFDIDAPIGRDPRNPVRRAIVASGKRAVTHIKVIRDLGDRSLLGIRLETGRNHQIRVHLRSIAHPVVGDPLYGVEDGSPLQLHAAYVSFDHPLTGERIACFVPPPPEFEGREWATRESIEEF